MPSFRNPVPATAACYEHPFSSSAAASYSDQSLNIHGSSSTFNVYNYYSSGRGGTVHSSKVSSAYVTPGQSVTSPPFKMSGRLSHTVGQRQCFLNVELRTRQRGDLC